eukprot:7730-Heterococcus_DN1.PRE.3
MAAAVPLLALHAAVIRPSYTLPLSAMLTVCSASFRNSNCNSVTAIHQQITLSHYCLQCRVMHTKTGAAIEHYRRGVDANPKDFRAWNGLGHTYEFMQMHLFALYYFRRAAALRPFDARMLNSLGSTYEKLGRSSDAARVYRRSVAVNDPEGCTTADSACSTAQQTVPLTESESCQWIALAKLAKLYSSDNNREQATACYLQPCQFTRQLPVQAIAKLACIRDTSSLLPGLTTCRRAHTALKWRAMQCAVAAAAAAMPTWCELNHWN